MPDKTLPAWVETLPRHEFFLGDYVKWADLVAACPPEEDVRQRVQDLESELEDQRVKALWDADYAKGDIEQAHAKTIAMFGSTMARQAADYMAECLLAALPPAVPAPGEK